MTIYKNQKKLQVEKDLDRSKDIELGELYDG